MGRCRVAVPRSTIGKILAGGGIEKLEQDGLPTLGPPRRVLTADQEDYAAGLVIIFNDKNKPLCKKEL